MPYAKTCALATCKQLFTTKFKSQRYCSKACGRTGRMISTPDAVRDYLMQHVIISDGESPCWEWQGYLDDQGRAVACVRGTRLRASRLSYELFIGPIPNGLYVLHSCDNGRCISPTHLRCGTPMENMQDKLARDRQIRGSKHYSTHLTEKMSATYGTYVKRKDSLMNNLPHAITLTL